MSKRLACVLVGLSFLVLPACGGGGGEDLPSDSGPPDDGGGSGNVTAEMTIEDNAFVDPQGRRNGNASVTIQTGEAVRWTYESSGTVQHTVTSGEGAGGSEGDGVPEGAGQGMNSPNLNAGETFTFTFNTPGTWTYFCQVHPGIMINATVIVE